MGDDLNRLPSRTAVAYAVVAGGWILITDLLLLGEAMPTAVRLRGTGKGLAFVVVTALGLWWGLRRMTGRVVQAHAGTAQERHRFEALVERSSDVIAVLDRDGALTYASPSVKAVLGWEPADVTGRQLLDVVHPDDRGLVGEAAEAVLSGQRLTQPVGVRIVGADGEWRHLEVSASPPSTGQALPGVVLNARDVTDRVRVERALNHATAHDPVTGLRNRQQFEADLRGLFDRARSFGEKPVVMVVDVDRFREVNDQIGTRGGDEVLHALARRLDVEGQSGGLTGRLGGDRMAVAVSLSDGSRAEAEVQLMVQGLRHRLGRPVTAEGQTFALSVSCGAAACMPDAAPLEALTAAEEQVAEAKGLPDRVAVVVDPPSVPDRLRSEELQRALERDELILVFQPQESLRTGEVVGLEALLRWEHPTRGLLTPAAFLQEVGGYGLQPAVTRRVLEVAAAFLARLDAAGLSTRTSVNLSLDDLARSELVGEVLGALDRHGVDPSRLRLELTERALLVRPEQSLATMHELRGHGLSFSVDDFGTGFSSLAHLRTLPLDEVKIDRSFVAELHRRRSAAIVHAIVDLCCELELEVVAEGIEDAQTADALARMGCNLGQGYHLGRPARPDAIVAQLIDDGPAAGRTSDRRA